MNIKIKYGITITIDDDELVRWDHDKKINVYSLWLKDGSRWDYLVDKKIFLKAN